MSNRIHLPRTHLVLLVVSVVFGVIACAIQGTGHRSYAPVPPQQWQSARGPVVPHDTFPRDCALCHAGSTWHAIKDDFVFDHEKETGVRLEGAHSAAECLRCHNDRGPVAEFAQQGCSGCHEDVHRGKLGKRCADCHAQSNWLPNEQVARHARTRFPLVGSHAAVACFRCHDGADVGNFDRASIECVDCHRDQIAQAVSPNHVTQGWTSGCDRCHIPTTWNGAGFNHVSFALTGQHAVIACNQCHVNDVFAGTPSTCVACHQDDFAATTRPSHTRSGFPTSCDQCHSTSSWQGASFSHSVWPLTGAHAVQTCTACHSTGIFRGTPSACVACHQAEYNATTDPNHAANGLPTTCQQCHNTSSWSRANFTHQGITSGCVNCHQGDFNGATNPNHAALGYPTACQNCHTTTTWQGAMFNHTGITSGCVNCHQNDYNGAANHAALGYPTACQSCHTTAAWKGANFNHRGIASGCVTCHQNDYNTTNNPNHATAGFPTTCQTCHTTVTWSGATFTHSQFPITSGPHQNITCQECHNTPTNYAVFTCTNCHAHQPAATNGHHQRVSGYSYNSSACYTCHPTGQGD